MSTVVHGGVAERTKAAVLKTVVPFLRDRGFESLRLRPAPYGAGHRPVPYGSRHRPVPYSSGLRPVPYGTGLRPNLECSLALNKVLHRYKDIQKNRFQAAVFEFNKKAVKLSLSISLLLFSFLSGLLSFEVSSRCFWFLPDWAPV